MTGDSLPYLELVEEDQIASVMSPDAGAVVIDVWSPSCGPCMAMAEGFAAVARAFDPGEVRFCKLNAGELPHLAGMLEIRSLPTLLYVLNGQVQDVLVGGSLSPERIGKRAEWLLNRAQPKKNIFARLLGRG